MAAFDIFDEKITSDDDSVGNDEDDFSVLPVLKLQLLELVSSRLLSSKGPKTWLMLSKEMVSDTAPWPPLLDIVPVVAVIVFFVATVPRCWDDLCCDGAVSLPSWS